MACVKPDGSLTALGRAVLEALVAGDGGGEVGSAAEEIVAEAVDKPLYLIRSILRELAGYGLAEPDPDGENRHRITDDGREKLDLP